MVEFGLKLEDNKVSEWSERYLNYEKLKAILKKAKALHKKYEEQAERRPMEAKAILKAHQSGDPNYVTTGTPTPSGVNLVDMEGVAGGITEGMKYEEPSERTSLLEATSGTIGNSNSAGAGAGLGGKKKPNFAVSISDISDYFGSRYERTLRGYLKECDDKSAEFKILLTTEKEKVVKFYHEKLSELESRLELLIESVAESPTLGKKALLTVAADDDDAEDAQQRREAVVMSANMGTRRRRNNSQKFDDNDHLPTPQKRIADIISKLSHSLKQEKRVLEAKLRRKEQHQQDLELVKDDSDDEADRKMDEKAHAEADSVQRALIDQYRTAKLLHNFAILNYTGFVKICKKHDKSLPEEKGKYKDLLRAENLFDEGEAVDVLAKQYETYYANWFCEGDLRAAHAQMLPKRGDGLEMDWSQLRLGYRMGMAAVLALWVCWDCVWGLVEEGNSTIGGRAAFPVFRGCGGILLLQWFWGCSVFIWTRYRINYIYLFDFNPRIVATPLGIFEEAVDNTLVFLLLMLLYYKSGANAIPQWIPEGGYPFMLVLYTTYKLIFPLRTRVPMWEAIRNVIMSPLHSPSFFHGYVGDIFTSMVKVFQDIAWTVCWVFSGAFTISEDLKDNSITTFEWSNSTWYKGYLIPVICLLPLVIRFNQCLRRYIDTGDRFPHLANATKYALSQTVTLFGAFHPLYLEYTTEAAGQTNLFQVFWMILFVSSSLYSFAWDVRMDWGLGRPEYNFLGPSLMFPRRYYYYSVMAVDLVLRFMWVLTLVPPSSGARFEVPSYLNAVTMMLELFRRTIWGFFRLENEHRSNAAGFRRVSFVPLHFNTGHHHGYKDKQEKSGMAVLREVVLIALLVAGVCVSSVIAAQRANQFSAKMEL